MVKLFKMQRKPGYLEALSSITGVVSCWRFPIGGLPYPCYETMVTRVEFRPPASNLRLQPSSVRSIFTYSLLDPLFLAASCDPLISYGHSP